MPPWGVRLVTALIVIVFPRAAGSSETQTRSVLFTDLYESRLTAVTRSVMGKSSNVIDLFLHGLRC